MKRNWLIIGLIGLVGLGGGLLLSSNRYQMWLAERQKENLPRAENLNYSYNANTNNINSQVNDNDNTNTNANTNTSALPNEKNLAVPFTSQAPNGNWDQDHEEFCEEASVLMVGRYWKHLPISDTTDAEAALQKIKAWELDNLGFYFDTTAAETAKILEGLYVVKTRLVVDPTVDQIKQELAAGRPVIVPTAGRELGNPYFTAPGPLYHMLVLKGYTSDGNFISNDAGTKHGADYVYRSDVVMKVMHDWIPGADRFKAGNGTTTGGRKVVIFTEPK